MDKMKKNNEILEKEEADLTLDDELEEGLELLLDEDEDELDEVFDLLFDDDNDDIIYKNPRLNRGVISSDFILQPVDMNSPEFRFALRTTESLEYEYMQRSVLEERDEYDEELFNEIKRRHQLREELSNRENMLRVNLPFDLDDEFDDEEDELEEEFDLLSDDVKENFIYKNPRLNRCLIPSDFILQPVDMNSPEFRFALRTTESLEYEYMQRSVLEERDEYDEELFNEIKRRHQLRESLANENDEYLNFLSSCWTDYLNDDEVQTLSRRR